MLKFFHLSTFIPATFSLMKADLSAWKKNLNNHIIKQVTQNHDAAVHSSRCHPPKRYFTTKSVLLWGRTLAFSTAHKSQSSPHPAKGASSEEFSDASRTSLLFRSSVAATYQGKSGPPNSSAQNPAEVALLGLRGTTFFPRPMRAKRFLQQQHKGHVQGSQPSLSSELVYPENLKLRWAHPEQDCNLNWKSTLSQPVLPKHAS